LEDSLAGSRGEDSLAGSQGADRDDIVARHGGLVGRTVLVSGLTFLSRILGFVREVITAAVFGDGSAVSDAFFTAWRVPNLFRRLFGEGALSTSLQTAITEADDDQGPAAGRRLFRGTLVLTSWILVVVTLVAMLVVHAMPDLMPLTAWRWLGEDPAPVRDLTVRLMPFVLLVCLTALCGGALQVRGHYVAPNLAPTVMNLVWIAALAWVGLVFGLDASTRGDEAQVLATQWEMARWVAWGVLVGGLVQLVIQLPALRRFGLFGAAGDSGGEVDGGGPGLSGAWRVLAASAPLAVGAAVYQINVMIDGLMAEGLLADGGPTALYYANRVQQFPLALIAIATTNAVFPSLKALGHRGRLRELRDLHDRSQLGIVFLALPAGLGLFVLAQPIASLLFEHGNYGAGGTARVAAALRMLALALVPAGAVGLLGRAYYALGDFRTPVRISIVAMAFNVVANVLFVRGLGLDVEGLALATALSSCVSLALLLPRLRRKGLPSSALPSAARLVRVGLAAVGATACAWGAQRGAAHVGAPLFASVGLAAAAGIVAHLLLARLFGAQEWDEVRRRFGGR